MFFVETLMFLDLWSKNISYTITSVTIFNENIYI